MRFEPWFDVIPSALRKPRGELMSQVLVVDNAQDVKLFLYDSIALCLLLTFVNEMGKIDQHQQEFCTC